MTNTNEARVEITTRCNYNCIFCPNSSNDFKRKRSTMSLETFKIILNKLSDEAPYISELTLSGMGEPFLDKSIFEKIRFAKQKNFNLHIFTNSSLLDYNKINELYSLNIDSLRVSLHAINNFIYKKITRSDNVDLVVRNIDYMSKKFKDNIKLYITTDVTEANKNEVETLIKNFKDKVDLLEIWKPHNWANWKNFRDGTTTKKTCSRPINGPLQIQVDGTINMCCFDFNGELLLGNFLRQDLKEIFSSKMYKNILCWHRFLDKSNSNLLCKNCDQLRDTGDVIIFNSKFKDHNTRMNKLSTTLEDVVREDK